MHSTAYCKDHLHHTSPVISITIVIVITLLSIIMIMLGDIVNSLEMELQESAPTPKAKRQKVLNTPLKLAIQSQEATLKAKTIGKKVLNTPLKEAIKGKTAALKPKKIGKTVPVHTLLTPCFHKTITVLTPY
jgi:predicted Holliday junction resolvase-like endonuclease